MVCLELPSQLVFVVAGVVAFVVLDATGGFNWSLFRNLRYIFDRYGTRIFMAFNAGGLLTTNLLTMSSIHVIELTPLILVFLYEIFYRPMILPLRIHHVLSILGISLQLHIGVGGALMSYLLLDELTDYIVDRPFFWIAFVVMRIIGYNVVLAIAVKQGVAQAAASVAVRGWLASVVIWWIFSAFYHIHWIWTKRYEVADAFATRKSTCDHTRLGEDLPLSSGPAARPLIAAAAIW
jgi:hypothetical protein